MTSHDDFPHSEPAIAVLRDKIERAIRNGQKAHLNPADIAALVRCGALELISQHAAKEIAKCLETKGLVASRSENSGYSGGPTAMSGKLHGMIAETPDDRVASAASRRAALIVAQVKGRRTKP